tara:strand:- start:433 stop:657 length:225 start_codon:yes stop_codon:yes gene_type:complete
MTQENLKTEIELLKKEINVIKSNHLTHIEKDIEDLKVDVKHIKSEVLKFKHIGYGAIAVFVLMSDKFNDILRLL